MFNLRRGEFDGVNLFQILQKPLWRVLKVMWRVARNSCYWPAPTRYRHSVTMVTVVCMTTSNFGPTDSSVQYIEQFYSSYTFQNGILAGENVLFLRLSSVIYFHNKKNKHTGAYFQCLYCQQYEMNLHKETNLAFCQNTSLFGICFPLYYIKVIFSLFISFPHQLLHLFMNYLFLPVSIINKLKNMRDKRY